MSTINNIVNGINKLKKQEIGELLKWITSKQKRVLQVLLNQGVPPSPDSVPLVYADWDDDLAALFQYMRPLARQELFEKVYINKVAWQMEFPELKLAIRWGKELPKDPMTREDAENFIAKIGNGWRLPKDLEPQYTCDEDHDPWHNPYDKTINAQYSDYDKIIMHMPGNDLYDKVANFASLTGIDGVYWVWTGLAVRGMDRESLDRYKESDNQVLHHIHPVKDI